MKFLGHGFISVGILSFLLSLLGIQFKFMKLFGGSFKFSIALTVIGILMLAITPDKKEQSSHFSLGHLAVMIVFASGLAWFIIPKHSKVGTATQASRENPTDLYNQCFKKQTSESCRKLAGYYRELGNISAANSSMYKACVLGDRLSCGGLERQPASVATNP